MGNMSKFEVLSRATEEAQARWIEYEIPWRGELKKGTIPGVGDALVAILEQEEDWNSVWKLLGQFLLCIQPGETPLCCCERFKQKLAALEDEYTGGERLVGWQDTVT